jgi:acyl carrier protein
MSSEIIGKLKSIIQPYLDEDEVDVNEIKLHSNLIQDLGLDSFYVIDLIIDIETEFDITIDNDQISQFETVESVVRVIEEKMAEK